MSLSEDILDDIDGAEESTGRDSRLTEWAHRAEQLEDAVLFAREMARWAISGTNPSQTIHDIRNFLTRTGELLDFEQGKEVKP